MTQNQSGKQLFEWKPMTKELIPSDKKQKVLCRYFDSNYPNEVTTEELYPYQINNLLSYKDRCVMDFLSPAQPSTGKQLPTDEEIELAAIETYPEQLLGLRKQIAFSNGARWMRERAQGESDKWIRVEDGLPHIVQYILTESNILSIGV